MTRLWRALLALAVLAAAAGGAGAWYARRAFLGPGPLAEARAVVIPHGGTIQVAQALLAAGAIRDVTEFRAALWWTRHEPPVRAGEFALAAHAPLAEVLHALRYDRPVLHRITIAEGLTAVQIAHVLEQDPLLTGTVAVPAEGAVLPQTYSFERGTPRAAILAQAEAAMQAALASVWADRAEGLALATPRDLLILASIVERETAKPEERAMVAAVYLNRLRLGMRLQADPTVAYAATGGTTLDHPPTRADLDAASPYNTYRVAGLPPGPIDSPGLASLQAVAHPAGGKALYFVADGTGGHVFAETLEQHNRNVARWRAQLPKRN